MLICVVYQTGLVLSTFTKGKFATNPSACINSYLSFCLYSGSRGAFYMCPIGEAAVW